jgi:hypothetical protein
VAVKLKENCKAIIPLTKLCHDFLKGIFPKEYHQQIKMLGLQSVQCVINTTKRRECSGNLPLRLVFVLRAVSRHCTPSQIFKFHQNPAIINTNMLF